MTKRIIAALLCLLLLAATFAACARQDDAKPAADPIKFDTVDGAYSSYDTSTVSAYSDLCKAVYNAESEVRFNTGMFNDVIQLFYTSYPLSFLVKDITKMQDGSGVNIVYNKTQDEIITISKDFSDKVQSILTECRAGKINTRAFIINAYNYTATHISNSDKDGLNVYAAIMNGEGDSFTASGMFEYLLRQGGVNSSHIIARDSAGASWGVSIAQIDGENFLFDPMTEIIANKGTQLCYFGMTNEDAKAEGLKEFYYTNQAKAPVCDNPFFDLCRQCKAWEFSSGCTDLLVTQNDGKVVQVAL